MNPSSYHVRYNGCQVGQPQVNHTVKFHLKQSLIDAFLTFAADGRGEAQMKVAEVALYHSRFEREAKKIEGHVMHFKWWMLLLVALAINNIALAVFNLQFTLLKSQLYRFQRPQGLFEVLAMDDDIICIPFKLYLRMALL